MSTTPQPIGNMSLIGRTKEVLSTKLGFVMATEMENKKKRHPRKDVSTYPHLINKGLIYTHLRKTSQLSISIFHIFHMDSQS